MASKSLFYEENLDDQSANPGPITKLTLAKTVGSETYIVIFCSVCKLDAAGNIKVEVVNDALGGTTRTLLIRSDTANRWYPAFGMFSNETASIITQKIKATSI